MTPRLFNRAYQLCHPYIRLLKGNTSENLQHYLNRLKTPAIRVLIVCTGNICRSAFVAGLARDCATLHPLTVLTAGTRTKSGLGADPAAVRAASRLGIDLSSHRTTAITANMLREADVIFVMEPYHSLQIARHSVRALQKTFLFAGLTKDRPNPTMILDPYGRSEEEFDAVFIQLRESWNEWLRIVSTRYPGGLSASDSL